MHLAAQLAEQSSMMTTRKSLFERASNADDRTHASVAMPAQHDRSGPIEPKRLIDVGLVKCAEAPLRRIDIRFGLVEQIRHLGPLRPPDGMVLHLSLEDEIPGQEAVHGEDHRDAERLRAKAVSRLMAGTIRGPVP